MTIWKSTKKKSVVSKVPRSARFAPSRITETLVPLLLIALVIGLVVVLVIVGLSLLGITPSA